jgi:Tol biopolymer transport system component
LLLFSDIPGSSGIGGIAHFPVWRPDGSAVTLIANDGDGLSTYLIDVNDRTSQVVSDGAPVYAEWSRDGAHLLVHTLDELVLHDFDSSGTRTRQGVIGTGSTSYRVARFSPVSNDYLYVNTDMDLSGLYKGNPSSTGSEFIANVRDGSAFSWAPGDERIAFADANRAGYYQSLSIIDLAGDAEDVVVNAPIIAFWWSPDGEKILLAVLGDGPDNIGLVVIDARTGDANVLGLIEPSEEMNFTLSFFDQYDVDQQMWSPDSTRFVFSGILGDGLADAAAGRPVQFGSVEPSVWVIDASGVQPPISLGAGTFATWSPG